MTHAWIASNTAEHIIKILPLSDRPIVFRHQGLLRKSGGFTPNGYAKYKGLAIFDTDFLRGIWLSPILFDISGKKIKRTILSLCAMM